MFTSTHTLSGVQIKSWYCTVHRIFNIPLWGRLYKSKLKPELSFIISIAILAKNVSNRVKRTRNILYVLKTVQLNHFIFTICTLNLMFLFLYVKKLYYMCYNVYVQISHIHHEIPSCLKVIFPIIFITKINMTVLPANELRYRIPGNICAQGKDRLLPLDKLEYLF